MAIIKAVLPLLCTILAATIVAKLQAYIVAKIAYRKENNKTAGAHEPEKIIIDIPAQIEQLAKLHESGVLTDEEFYEKKAELLKRL